MSTPFLAGSGGGWRTWLVRSDAARMLGTAVCVMAAVGAGTAGTIAIAALIRQRPMNGVVYLLPLAIPLVAVGQLWAIGWIQMWRPPRTGSWLQRSLQISAAGQRDPLLWFFGPLDRRVGRGLTAVFVAGWLLAMTATPSIGHGGPGAPGGGCPYRLDNHGSLTCVSRSTYEHAGAGVQRFVAGILLAFFAMHVGAALGGRRAQRDASS